MKVTADATLSFKLPPNLKQLLKGLAKEEKTTVSKLLVTILTDTTNFKQHTTTNKLISHENELH